MVIRNYYETIMLKAWIIKGDRFKKKHHTNKQEKKRSLYSGKAVLVFCYRFEGLVHKLAEEVCVVIEKRTLETAICYGRFVL